MLMREPMLRLSQALRRKQEDRIISPSLVPDDRPLPLMNALSSSFIFNSAGLSGKGNKPASSPFSTRKPCANSFPPARWAIQRERLSSRGCDDNQPSVMCSSCQSAGRALAHLQRRLINRPCARRRLRICRTFLRASTATWGGADTVLPQQAVVAVKKSLPPASCTTRYILVTVRRITWANAFHCSSERMVSRTASGRKGRHADVVSSGGRLRGTLSHVGIGDFFLRRLFNLGVRAQRTSSEEKLIVGMLLSCTASPNLPSTASADVL
jgi:hypothetical protein